MGYHGDSIWDRLRIDTSSVEKTSIKEKLSGSRTTEVGKGVSSGVGVINKEETVGKEESSSGDSSSFFERRYESIGNVNSFGTINENGEYVTIEARSRTVTVNGVPHTTWQNVTTIRDANGKILRTYSNDDSDQFSATKNVSSVHGSFGAGSNTAYQSGGGNVVKINPYGTLNENGEYVTIEARSRTVTINGVPHTTWHNVTTFRDANGKVIRTFSNDDTDQESGGANFVDQGNFDTTWQTINHDERTLSEEQRRRLEEQQRQEQIRLRQEYERKQREELERRRQEEARRRQHGLDYGQGGTAYEEGTHRQNVGWSQSSGGRDSRIEDEDRRVYEGTSGVQESKYYKEHAYQVGGGSREGIQEVYNLLFLVLYINNLPHNNFNIFVLKLLIIHGYQTANYIILSVCSVYIKHISTNKLLLL